MQNLWRAPAETLRQWEAGCVFGSEGKCNDCPDAQFCCIYIPTQSDPLCKGHRQRPSVFLIQVSQEDLEYQSRNNNNNSK